MIIVQRIETEWTKLSRGMPNAAKRNAVPRKMSIPLNDNINDGIYVHEIKISEKDDFDLHQETYYMDNAIKYWSLFFNNEAGFVKVQFKYSYWEHGKPDRGKFKKTLFKLRKNEIGVLHINGRFTSYSGQHYTQHFVNIANTTEVCENIFMNREPTYFVNKMADLF